jgi:predicted nucleotidyltransferase
VSPKPLQASAPAQEARAVQERLDLIDGAIYADLFGCAVTLEELWCYSRLPVAREDIGRQIADDPALAEAVREQDGLYCLAGREALLKLRPHRLARARKLQRRASLVARALQHVPFVRGLLLTGSASADDAEEDADVDLLVLVEPGRLSIAFTLLGGLSRLLTRRVLCPNHYLATTCVALEGERDLYLAREITQAYPLTGQADALYAANGWVRSLLPNASRRPTAVRPREGRPLLQRLLEWPLRDRAGDALDRRLQPLVLARLEHHHRLSGTSVPADVVDDLRAGAQLRFHASAERESVLARYEQRRAQMAAQLAREA